MVGEMVTVLYIMLLPTFFKLRKKKKTKAGPIVHLLLMGMGIENVLNFIQCSTVWKGI